MKKNTITLLMFIVMPILVSGCVKTSIEEITSKVFSTTNPPVTTSTATSISRQWASPALDLRSYRSPANQLIRFEFDVNLGCECTTSSSSAGGVLVLSQCKNITGSLGEIGCSLYNGQYTLNQSNGVLQICDATGFCNQFQ